MDGPGEGCATGRDRPALVLLANPTAGGGGAGRVARQAVRTFAGLGHDAVLVEPLTAESVLPAVREAAGELTAADRPARALVAVGGDGTVRVAASAARETGLPLGVVPAGTGNGVAYSLGLPLDPWEACRIVAAGEPVPCDLGLLEFAGGSPSSSALFLNVAGVGLDAEISRVYHEDGLRVRGVPGYALAAVRSLWTYRPVPLSLEVDGEGLELEALLLAIGNGSFYGKGIRIVPHARPTDGWLDVCVVLEAGLADLPSLVPMLLLGRHLSHPKVRTFRARTLKVTGRAAGGSAVPVHADGDLVGYLPVRVSVVPGGIRLVLRADRPARPGTDRAAPTECPARGRGSLRVRADVR